MAGQIQKIPAAHERLEELGARVLSDAELFTILLGPSAGANNVREAAASSSRSRSARSRGHQPTSCSR
jgi:DNA repair protein RadC